MRGRRRPGGAMATKQSTECGSGIVQTGKSFFFHRINPAESARRGTFCCNEQTGWARLSSNQDVIAPERAEPSREAGNHMGWISVQAPLRPAAGMHFLTLRRN